jgi:hypothetical protein
MWSTYQIVNTIAWNLAVTFPEPFAGLLRALSFFQLDFLSLDCLRSGTNFFDRVYAVTFVPVVVAAAIAATYAARSSYAKGHAAARVWRWAARQRSMLSRWLAHLAGLPSGAPSAAAAAAFLPVASPEQLEAIDNQHATAFLLLSYLVLPTCSLIQFEGLNCRTLGATSGASFLRVDSSVDCHSKSYALFRAADCFFIFVYQVRARAPSFNLR